MEDKKTPASDKAVAKEKKRKGKKTTAAVAADDSSPEASAVAADDAPPEALAAAADGAILEAATSEKSQSNSIVVSAEPVALPADWASGAIAVVSHGAVGEIAVIHADGTQIQPMVTSDGAGVISLDASDIPIPYSEAPVLPATSETAVVASHAILAAELHSQALSGTTAAGAGETAAEGPRTSDEASAEREAAGDQV